jgi:DNA mismatch repair protein MutS
VAVAEEGEELVFLRKIVPGGADRSYGIHVARLAGVPKSILKRAEDILRELEQGGSKERRRAVMADSMGLPAVPANGQLSFLAGNGPAPGATPDPAPPDPVVEELRELKVDDMTPLEAMGKLYELVRKARDSAQ